jgi:hypothetical protein
VALRREVDALATRSVELDRLEMLDAQRQSGDGPNTTDVRVPRLQQESVRRHLIAMTSLLKEAEDHLDAGPPVHLRDSIQAEVWHREVQVLSSHCRLVQTAAAAASLARPESSSSAQDDQAQELTRIVDAATGECARRIEACGTLLASDGPSDELEARLARSQHVLEEISVVAAQLKRKVVEDFKLQLAQPLTPHERRLLEDRTNRAAAEYSKCCSDAVWSSMRAVQRAQSGLRAHADCEPNMASLLNEEGHLATSALCWLRERLVELETQCEQQPTPPLIASLQQARRQLGRLSAVSARWFLRRIDTVDDVRGADVEIERAALIEQLEQVSNNPNNTNSPKHTNNPNNPITLIGLNTRNE